MTVSGTLLKRFLKETFDRYHHAKYISPDPLELVYRYHEPLEREVVGLIASSLAYGRVAQILRSVEWVLARMGPSPRTFVEKARKSDLEDSFQGFKHRFSTHSELVNLLMGMQGVIRRHGSLRACFRSGIRPGDETTAGALCAFVRELRVPDAAEFSSLIPRPEKNSACKRLHLYLRWMVRSDEIDPGVWPDVSPARLIVPLDTHMFGTCRVLGMTSRSQAHLPAALEITQAFRDIDPDDPVKYDFSLTRIGIRREEDLSRMIASCAG
jgi:uncharacterized protein (TIGR02757 family)